MSIPLYDPLNQLKKVDDDIWIVDGGLIKMSVLAFGIPFSTRMTVVRLTDGSLWLHSPVEPDDQLFEAIDALGAVKHLVSPNKIHYAFISDWKKRYPEATAWSSPGVEERAASQDIPVDFDASLEDKAPAGWSEEIDQLIFKGSRVLEEVVFFHKKSRTLILTDLIENFEPEQTTNPLWRFVYKAAGIAHPDGQTPVDMRLTFAGNKDKARRCYNQVLQWQPEKIILAHGKWYEKDGTVELKRAFRWLDK